MANNEKRFRVTGQNMPYLSNAWRCNSYSPKCVARYDNTMAFPHLGLDLIGFTNPPSNGYMWILAATEYFTKLVEAIPLKKATGAAVANFIRKHIVMRFGIPKRLISDNGLQGGY